MSNSLAIAAVTGVIKSLLNKALSDSLLSMGSGAKASAVPPDRVLGENGNDPARLNLFLYQATENMGWRNVGLPSHNAIGEPLTNPPLALDLHYLLTAYGDNLAPLVGADGRFHPHFVQVVGVNTGRLSSRNRMRMHHIIWRPQPELILRGTCQSLVKRVEQPTGDPLAEVGVAYSGKIENRRRRPGR